MKTHRGSDGAKWLGGPQHTAAPRSHGAGLEGLTAQRIAAAGFALLMALIVSVWNSLTDILIWLGLYGVAVALDLGVANRFVAPAVARRDNRRAHALTAAMQGLVMAVLASVALWAYVPHDASNNYQLLAALALAVITVANFGMTEGVVLAATLVPFGLVLLLAPWVFGMEQTAELSVLLAIFVGYMVLIASRQREQRLALRAARDEGARLADQLGITSREADQGQRALEVAHRTKAELIAGLQEGMRAPLNHILMAGEALREQAFGPLDNESYRDSAATLQRNGAQLMELLDDIMLLAGTDAARMRTSFVHLPSLLSEVQKSFVQRASDMQVTLQRHKTGDLPYLLADERLVGHLTRNLVTEALRAARPGSSISVWTHLLPDGGLAIRVANSEQGIPEADLEQMLERFIQGDVEGFMSERPTSLGLIVVGLLAERHGGALSLRTRLGGGLQASVSFPPVRVVTSIPKFGVRATG